MSHTQLTSSQPLASVADHHASLARRLADFSSRHRLLIRVSRAILGVALIAAVVGLGAVFDAIFDWETWGRTAGFICSALAFVVAILLQFLPVRQSNVNSAARDIDQSQPTGGSLVSIAMGLTAQDHANDALSQQLAVRAVQRAEHTAQNLQPMQVYPTRSLLQPLTRLWWVVAGCIVIGLMFPGLLRTGMARLAFPAGDISAYNLTRLDVSWMPNPPEVGDDVAVTVRAVGLPAEQVELVILDKAGQLQSSIAMLSSESGEFSTLLRAVREPIRFRLRVNGRLTRMYVLSPNAEEENENEEEDGEQARSDPPSTDDAGEGGFTTRQPIADRDALVSLLSKITELREQIAGADPANAAEVAAIEKSIAQLLEEAQAIAGELDAEAGDALTQALQALAEQLANLSLADLPPGPSAPAGDPSQGDSAADAQDWLDQAAQAAAADQQTLVDGLGELDQATDSGTISSNGDNTVPNTDSPRAQGRYAAEQATADTGDLPPATLERIPPRYRNHIVAYFRQLTKQGDAPSPRDTTDPAPEAQP